MHIPYSYQIIVKGSVLYFGVRIQKLKTHKKVDFNPFTFLNNIYNGIKGPTTMFSVRIFGFENPDTANIPL